MRSTYAIPGSRSRQTTTNLRARGADVKLLTFRSVFAGSVVSFEPLVDEEPFRRIIEKHHMSAYAKKKQIQVTRAGTANVLAR